jgi:exonuclease III
MYAFLTLNVKGLVSHHKQLSLQDYSQRTSSSVLFLQETNLSQDSSFVYPQIFHFFINPPVQPSSGVAIALKAELYHEANIFSHDILVPGYLQAVHCQIKDQDFHLVNVYMPHVTATAKQVLTAIHQYISKINQESFIILAGDWNTTLFPEDRRNCSEIRTDLVNHIKYILCQHDLTDVWRNFNPDKSQFTFRGLQANHPMARLDRIYIKSKFLHHASNSEIIPSFSDHSGVTLKLNTTKQIYKPPYWKFDPTLLRSTEFQEIVKNIIAYFEEKSNENDSNIISLWDSFKEEISRASQRHLKKIKQEEFECLRVLESQINYIDSKHELCKKDEQVLIQIEREISNLYRFNSSEKLKIIENQVCKEANTQSKFFLRLSKQAKPSTTISQLEINEEVITEKKEVLNAVHTNFKQMFECKNPNKIEPTSILYQDLPTLSDCDKQYCEKPISEEELFESVKNAQINRAPGLDGIPIEFYKFFWKQLKTIFLKVIQNFENTGNLPKSMKKVVITPVPKKGNRMFLKNWRPIALLNTDYKIISRVYSTRISAVITSLLLSDQSYCVPGRNIYNNLHTIRNLIRHSNTTNSPLAVLALDQVGAFNNVNHSYLHHLLKSHGFGPKLSTAISSLLLNTQGHVKIGSSLLPPFSFEKGFRQGDPLAGPLYILSVEPFLRISLKNIGPRGYPIPKSPTRIKLSAFADDLYFFLTEEDDFDKVPQAFTIYSQQSGAELNQLKSTGLFCGQWKIRKDHPLQCQWSVEGIKALGVHFGNSTAYENKNWEPLITKVKGTLNKWSQFVKLTSYYGRRIISNQLAGSQLIHVLNVMQPPKEFIHEINQIMVNFVWQGKHWLHPNYVYAPPEKGGIGLNHLEAKILSLRLTLAYTIQKKLEAKEQDLHLHNYNLSLCGNISPQHIFTQHKDPIKMANLDPFYQSLLNAWHTINPQLITTTFPISFIRQTPLYGSKIVNEEELNIYQDWKNNGFNSLQQLMEPDGQWKTLQLNNFPITIQRRLSYNYNKIKIYFNKKIHQPEDQGENHKIEFKFQETNNQRSVSFPATKKIMYQTCLFQLMQKPVISGKPIWVDKIINWTSLYNYPIDRRDSDISWRLLHNALVTPRRLKQWQVIISSLCPWCQKEGNIMHMIFHCDQPTPLWKYVSSKIKIINQGHSLTFEQALLGFPPVTPQAKLSNFLLSLVKSTIYRTYMNSIKEIESPKPNYLAIFKKRLQYRLSLEAHHAKLTRTEEHFQNQFFINDALSLNP